MKTNRLWPSLVALIGALFLTTAAEAQCRKCDFEGYGGTCMVGRLQDSFTDCWDWGPMCANTGERCPGSGGPVSLVRLSPAGAVLDAASVQVHLPDGTTELRTCYGALVAVRKALLAQRREDATLSRIVI